MRFEKQKNDLSKRHYVYTGSATTKRTYIKFNLVIIVTVIITLLLF